MGSPRRHQQRIGCRGTATEGELLRLVTTETPTASPSADTRPARGQQYAGFTHIDSNNFFARQAASRFARLAAYTSSGPVDPTARLLCEGATTGLLISTRERRLLFAHCTDLVPLLVQSRLRKDPCTRAWHSP